MIPLLLVATVLAGQPGEDGTHPVAPAPAGNVYRCLLLPDALDCTAGDAAALLQQADDALTKAIPDRFAGNSTWRQEANDLLYDPLAEIEPSRFEAVLKPAAPALELYERAARCARADWRFFTDAARRGGFTAGLPSVPNELQGANLFALRARLHLKHGRPVEAIRSLALALSLARHLNTCPLLYQHQQAVLATEVVLGVLAECQDHPDCPSLVEALALLPRPLLSPRAALEGERLLLSGTLPAAERLRADPAGTHLNAEELARLDRAYRILWSLARQRIDPTTARLQMGLAIQKADTGARAALREAGYPEEVVAATPALNAAILHALLAGEERLGRWQEALSLPHAEGRARLTKLAVVPQGTLRPGEPALPTARGRLSGEEGLFDPAWGLERRLDLLRVVEALRRHAHRTGAFPDKLADITGVAVPDDPLTGQPFEYEHEGDTAVVATPESRTPGVSTLVTHLRLRKHGEGRP